MNEPGLDEPRDPISALGEMAASIHEMFLAYVKAGFTEDQALYLVGQIIAARFRGTT